MTDTDDADELIAWVREAADELERAHRILDDAGAYRNAEDGIPLTLALRIAVALDTIPRP